MPCALSGKRGSAPGVKMRDKQAKMYTARRAEAYLHQCYAPVSAPLASPLICLAENDIDVAAE